MRNHAFELFIGNSCSAVLRIELIFKPTVLKFFGWQNLRGKHLETCFSLLHLSAIHFPNCFEAAAGATNAWSEELIQRFPSFPLLLITKTRKHKQHQTTQLQSTTFWDPQKRQKETNQATVNNKQNKHTHMYCDMV